MQGLVCGVLSFGLWGILPLYWRFVGALSPYQIFGQRVVWSFLFVCLLLLKMKKWKAFATIIRNPREWLRIIGPAFFIALNWLLYIWGVNNGYIIETSLGYYINPLVVALFGVLFFRERLSRLELVGIAFAAAGVVMKTLLYGKLPYISLVLAFTFAIYGALKKKSKLDSVSGLGFETLVVGIPALFLILTSEVRGVGITGNLPLTFWPIIAASGIITATPLLLFAEGTKRLPLVIMGFLQYISPSIQLVIGVFLFGEAFDRSSLAAFSLIWVGIALFTYSQYTRLREKREQDAAQAE